MATASLPRDHNGRILPDWSTLLQSGLFTDVTVRCGDREWKLHSALLCVKSAWFEKALCGNFKEAKSREINIQQIDPKLLDWTIKCIYHLVGYDFEEALDDLDGLRSLLDDPETGILAHLQLEETADYFLVRQISWYMQYSIYERLSSIGKLVLETYPREASKLESKKRRLGESRPLLDLLPQSERAILFQAIDYAFLRDYQNESIQQEFAEFAEGTNFWILHDNAFKTKLSSVPKLAVDILDLVMKSELGNVFHAVPRKCVHGTEHDDGEPAEGHTRWHDLRLGTKPRVAVVGHKDCCYWSSKCNSK